MPFPLQQEVFSSHRKNLPIEPGSMSSGEGDSSLGAMVDTPLSPWQEPGRQWANIVPRFAWARRCRGMTLANPWSRTRRINRPETDLLVNMPGMAQGLLLIESDSAQQRRDNDERTGTGMIYAA